VSDLQGLYGKARADVAGMLRYDLDNLSAEQATRLDIATALRVLLDNQTGKLLRGESLDARELLMASDALAKILPSLAEPQQTRSDPRLEMWLIYKQMRERGELNLKPLPPDEGDFQRRIDELEAENAALKAGSAPVLLGHAQEEATPAPVPPMLNESVPIDPPTSAIVPPGEIGVACVGTKPGPDDPKPPVTIEGKAVTPAPAASAAPSSRQPTWDDTPGGKAWQKWHDAGGSVGGDRWSNRNIP
jgi:hypothetical protein